MAQILSIHPTRGDVEDLVSITLQHDPTASGNAPAVAHVVFHDGVDAPTFNVTHHDFANRTLTIQVRVPMSAATGPIEVDLDGAPPLRSTANFTLERARDTPLRITQINPVMPAQGYPPNARLRITLQTSSPPGHVRVLFPRTDLGPPIVPARAPQVDGSHDRYHVTVLIPAPIATRGRVKVEWGRESALTRPLLFR